MNNPPKVSVVIPMYNAEKYIEECITSLRCQTLQEIEIIIIDDCSDDDSLRIVSDLSVADNRIRILQNDDNQGAGFCRNEGMKFAAGECIYFIDADDWIKPQTLATAYETLKTYGADFVEFGASRVNENGVKRAFCSAPFEIITDRTQWIQGYAENKYADMVWNKLFDIVFLRKNKIYFQKIVLVEDYLFTLHLCEKVNKAVALPDTWYNYRQHDESLTLGAVTEDKIIGYMKVLAETQAFLKRTGLLFAEAGKALLNDKIRVSARFVWRYMEKYTVPVAEELLLKATQEIFGEDYEWIYIFLSRLAHTYKNQVEYFLEELIESSDKIILYGTGDIGRNLYQLLTNRSVEVIAFADTNQDTWGTKFYDLEIVAPHAIKEWQFTKIIIAAANHKPIQAKLEDMGYRRHRDYEYYPIEF